MILICNIFLGFGCFSFRWVKNFCCFGMGWCWPMGGWHSSFGMRMNFWGWDDNLWGWNLNIMCATDYDKLVWWILIGMTDNGETLLARMFPGWSLDHPWSHPPYWMTWSNLRQSLWFGGDGAIWPENPGWSLLCLSNTLLFFYPSPMKDERLKRMRDGMWENMAFPIRIGCTIVKPLRVLVH